MAVAWWVGWIVATIASFFISCAFWTRVIADRVGSMDSPGAPVIWVAAVFGTWVLFLLPLIIVMYRKVDQAYEDARIRREVAAEKRAKLNAARANRQRVDEKDRRLPENLCKKLARIPEIIRRGQLVTLTLRDGSKVEHAFIGDRRDLLGVYGLEALSFSVKDVIDLEPTDLARLPDYHPEDWFKLETEAEAAP